MSPDTPYQPLMTGMELRRIRESLGLTRESFATCLGFADESVIRAYERGWVFRSKRRCNFLIPDPLADRVIQFAESYHDDRQEKRAKVLHIIAQLDHMPPSRSIP